MPTPSAALEMLMAGNQRFVTGAVQHPNQDAARRSALAGGQSPFATVLGCSDSRVAPEIAFDQGLGDLFVVRSAGHVLDPAVLGSVEYGVSVLSCPLVVVLGHESCGAVAAARAALDGGGSGDGYVRDVVEKVMPSVRAALAGGATDGAEFVAEQVRATVALLLERSRVLADGVEAGRVAVAGLFYRLTDGTASMVTA